MSTMTRAFERSSSTPVPACAADPELMFPVDESERAGQRTAGEARALAVCTVCPVLAECRRAVVGLGATSPLAYGVAGGMTREDRRAARADVRRLVSVDPVTPDGGSSGAQAPSQADNSRRAA